MALRDMVAGLGSVTASNFLSLQPTGEAEWLIHNIYHEGSVELYWSDGTNNLKFDSDPGAGAYAYHDFHCRNTYFLKVKNVETTTKLIGYDGIITHI